MIDAGSVDGPGEHQHCLEEVKVYLGKRSYAGRLAQCTKFLNE